MYNKDVLDGYEKSLRDANDKLTLAQEEMLKTEELHSTELQNVHRFFNILDQKGDGSSIR